MKISKLRIIYNKKDKMHDWDHILKLRKDVNILKKPYKKIDDKLLKFLTTFHGLGEFVKDNKKDFDPYYIRCLLRHNKNPKRIEEKIVFDANMFDNVGKRGIRKALLFGKSIGRTKQETFQYLAENIDKAKFHTKLGKKLGMRKIAIMKDKIGM